MLEAGLYAGAMSKGNCGDKQHRPRIQWCSDHAGSSHCVVRSAQRSL